MASSARDQEHFPNSYGTTAAPPPTPSTHSNHLSNSDAADVLSRLLRLPPTLSLPTRRSPSAATSPPLISLSDPETSLIANLRSASELGFFHLTDHGIPSQLPRSAESESRSLFQLSPEEKRSSFPKNWPLGFDADDEDDEHAATKSICLDSLCSTQSTELSLTSLREFTREMERVGLAVVEALSSALGFENPVREDPNRVCSLTWISEEPSTGGKLVNQDKIYPYVIGLYYQVISQKRSVLTDSGWVSVVPRVGSILVTLGDIAQVWSNGRVKKVRGRTVPCLGEGNNSNSLSLSLLVTLPLNSIVSPVLPPLPAHNGGDYEGEDGTVASSRFNPFSFEDYAWRVYHERLPLKDPLYRYRN